MENTKEMLRALSLKAGSDGKAALLIGVANNTYSRWKKMRDDFPSDDNALKIAALLDLDARYVLAIVQRDRAKNDQVKNIWNRIAAGFAMLILTATTALAPAPADAGTLHNSYSEYTLRRIWRWLAALFAAAALAGCASIRHGLENQNVQTPMVDVADVRALFAGDSITANWQSASQQRNAGISGATSSAIGTRFAQELQHGAPRYVHILAGTNDLRPDISPTYSQSATVANIAGMVSSARARNLPTIVGTVPPLDLTLFPTRAPLVAALNSAIIAAVRPLGAFVADYYAAMVLPTGLQNPALFADGIHPNASGYKVMEHVLRVTRREMWRTTKTPEERAAWRAKKNGAKS